MDVCWEKTDVRWVGFHPLVLFFICGNYRTHKSPNQRKLRKMKYQKNTNIFLIFVLDKMKKNSGEQHLQNVIDV